MPYIGTKYGSGSSGSSSSNTSTTYISSGTKIAPTITYNNGLGTVTIGDGTYRLFHTTNYTGVISEHVISGATFPITEHITTYICSDYNSGTPIIRTITDSSQFNWSNICPIYTVTRDGDNLSWVDWDSPSNGLPNKIFDRLIRTDRFSRESGLSIGESSVPIAHTIIVSAGTIWQGVYKNSMDSVDSSIDIVKMLYTDGTGNWIDSFITQYNNTQYDTGLGLATLTDGNYAVNWIFRMIGNTKEITVFLGDGDFDLNTAKASQLPNNIPASMSTNGMLIGRIIVLKGADTATQIDSAFVTKFAASTVTSHSGLTEIEGGDALVGHYYHSDQEINTDDDVEFASVTTNDYRSLADDLHLNADVGYDIMVHDNIIPSLNNSKTLGESGLVYAETFTRKVTSDDDLSLDALTGKIIVIKKSVLPDLTNTHSIGSSTKVIKEVFTEKVTSDVDLILGSAIGSDIILRNGNVDAGIITETGNWGIGNINPTKKLEITGDVLIDGDLSVDGTVTQVDVVNLDVTNKNINLAVTDTPTDALANGGGIVLKGTTDKTILWDNSNVEWDISDGLDVDGIVKANGTTSDGSTNIFIGKDSLGADVFKVDTDGKVTASVISPSIDSTTGVQITKADKITPIINVDTTNERVEIKGASAYGITQFIGNGLDAESSIGFKDSTDINDEAWVIGKNVGLSNTTGRFGIFYLNGEKLVITTDGNIGVGIGEPDDSAILDLTSTSKGFLCPRVTKAQRLLITPVEGLEVFDTTDSGKYCYSSGRWIQISGLAQLTVYKTVDAFIPDNTDIPFVTEINYNMGTVTSPSIPLKANKTYRVHAYVQIDGDGAAAGARFAFVNSSDNSAISGLKQGLVYTTTTTGHASSQPVVGGLYRPTSDISIKLRVISSSGTPKLKYDTFRIEIQQID